MRGVRPRTRPCVVVQALRQLGRHPWQQRELNVTTWWGRAAGRAQVQRKNADWWKNAQKRQGTALKNWVSQSYDKLLFPKLHDGGWCAGDAERGGRWRCARRTPCAASQHVVVKRGGDD